MIRLTLLLLLTAFLLLGHQCNGQTADSVSTTLNNTNKNDLSKSHLKGKIKSLTEKHFNVIDSLNNDTIEHINVTIYNEMGYRIEHSTYSPEGNLRVKETWKYDNNGNMLESINYKSDGSLGGKGIYTYDDSGNVIDANLYYPDSSLYLTYNIKYNDKGKKIEYNLYNPDGSSKKKTIYKYDDKENLIEQDKNTDGILRLEYVYKYDSKGHKIMEMDYNSEGSLQLKYIFKYDNNGNCILINKYNSDGSLNSKSIAKYDNKGNVIKSKRYYSTLCSKTKYFYIGDKVNKIEIRNYDSDGRFESKNIYNVDYDSTDNWIKRTKQVNGVLKQIDVREITYY